jgi:hypothetical protein
MRKLLHIAVLLVFAFSAFPFSQPAYARPPKIPRGFSLASDQTIDGCSYHLGLVLHEYTKGTGTLGIFLESPCLSKNYSIWEDIATNEFNVNGSLKSGKLKATIQDVATGTVVTTNIRLRSVENKPADYFNPANVTGTIVFPGLNLTFTFDKDAIGGIWYGT